jgi:hypothetical protein
MQTILYKCGKSEKLSAYKRGVVASIGALLSSFETGKTAGGDAWEAVFVVALLIRIACCEMDELLHLPDSVLQKCTLSYNTLWNEEVNGDVLLFRNAELLEDFVAHLELPASFPHVAVYYPSHARFRVYDGVVVVYDEHKTRRMVGYQLKEGREIPENPGQLCSVSVLIRAAAQQEAGLRRWNVASEAQIGSFLGETERLLVPKEWRKMEGGRRK